MKTYSNITAGTGMTRTVGRRLLVLAAVSLLTLSSATLLNAQKKEAKKLDAEATTALSQLLAKNKAAKSLAKTAKGVLIFPSVKKAGLVVGGQYGEGVLRVKGKTEAYYKNTAASFGLQVGGQKFGYVMFLMKQDALDYLRKSKGWEIGAGPTIAVMDEGAAASLTNATARDDVYVFFFNQKGLMAGLNIEGSKITKFDPDE